MDGSEQAPGGDGEGEGSRACCSPRVAESLGASLTCRELSEPVMLLFSQAAAHPRAVRSALRVRHLEA